MADIYLDTLSYYKTETDAMDIAEATRVNNALNTKINTSSLGSPSGTATLDATGTHATAEIPFSTSITVIDPLNEVSVVNPKQLDFVIQQNLTSTYDYTVLTGIVVTNNVYEEVCTLTTDSRPTGVYQITFSKLHTLNNVNNSAYFRFSTDGGLTWEEIRMETNSIADVIPSTIILPYMHAGGIAEFIVQARKELDSDILLIKKMAVIFESKDLS